MTSLVTLRHRTSYRYDRPVSLGPQTVRLHPRPGSGTIFRDYTLTAGPGEARIGWAEDACGNRVAEVTVAERITAFELDVCMTVDLTQRSSVSSESTVPPADEYRFPVPEAVLARRLTSAGEGTLPDLARLRAVNDSVVRTIRYERRMEPGVWTPDKTLTEQAGSCRDTAWLLIALSRQMGYAARFVSGYLVQPDAKTGEPGCDLHAWAEVFIPGTGWTGFDTTSGQLAAAQHIPLAVSASPEDAAPVSGLLDHCQSEFSVLMDVTPVMPAVTGSVA